MEYQVLPFIAPKKGLLPSAGVTRLVGTSLHLAIGLGKKFYSTIKSTFSAANAVCVSPNPPRECSYLCQQPRRARVCCLSAMWRQSLVPHQQRDHRQCRAGPVDSGKIVAGKRAGIDIEGNELRLHWSHPGAVIDYPQPLLRSQSPRREQHSRTVGPLPGFAFQSCIGERLPGVATSNFNPVAMRDPAASVDACKDTPVTGHCIAGSDVQFSDNFRPRSYALLRCFLFFLNLLCGWA